MSRGLSGRSRKPVKWQITPLIHEQIRRVYLQGTGNNEVNRLAASLGLPRWKISRYAQRQGWLAVQRKEPDWIPREIKILETHAHLVPERIQHYLKKEGFARSLTAIVLKRKRLNFLQNLKGQSATSLAVCFGVDMKTVQRWILQGRLQAKKRGTARTPRQGGDMWFIMDRDIRDFILTYPEFIDLRKVDKFWFIDLLAGKRTGEATWGPAARKDSEGLPGELEAGNY